MSPDEITPYEDDEVAAYVVDVPVDGKKNPVGDTHKTPPSDSTKPTPRE